MRKTIHAAITVITTFALIITMVGTAFAASVSYDDERGSETENTESGRQETNYYRDEYQPQEYYQGDGFYISVKPFQIEGVDDMYYVYLSQRNIFSDGLISFRVPGDKGESWIGYADKDGKVIVPAAKRMYNGREFYPAGNGEFHDGLCRVIFSDDNSQGFMDKTGKIVIGPDKGVKYSYFSEGLASKYDSQTELYSYIDKNGNTVIKAGTVKVPETSYVAYVHGSSTIPDYRRHAPFNGGVAIVGDFSNEFVATKIIDTKGNTIYEFPTFVEKLREDYSQDRTAYTIAGNYSEGALVCYTHEKINSPYLYVFLDTAGNITGGITRDAYTNDELHPVYDSGLYYSGDGEGYMFYPGSGSVAEFHSGLLLVTGRPGGYGTPLLYGALNTKGEIAVPLSANGPMTQYDSGLSCTEPAGDYAYASVIDTKGNVVVPKGEFQRIYQFSGGLALAIGMNNKSRTEYYVLEKHDGTAPAVQPKTAPGIDTATGWAQENLNEAFAIGLLPEKVQGAYAQAATRAEFCALAVALYEKVSRRDLQMAEAFDDTNDPDVLKMAWLKVVNGVGDNKFDPNGTLTREQAATMLSRLADALVMYLPSQTATFDDIGDASQYAVSAIGQMQATSIMGGVGNNMFDPKGAYTREQSIITILRLYNTIK